ncbi:hypothetical protein VTN77DRAFT_2554 [Rasamsonia byssochlamydoides]|uniref:uncharacterized protein n=1 Tax=Rasamsonia byssochlamydoides TaxID=89139 RepID=UPI00374289A4
MSTGILSTIEFLYHRDNKKQANTKKRDCDYPIFETVLDGALALALFLTYFHVMILSRDVMRNNVPGDFANLGCLDIGLLHGYAFVKAIHHHYNLYRLRKQQRNKHVNFVMCPQCSRTASRVGDDDPAHANRSYHHQSGDGRHAAAARLSKSDDDNDDARSFTNLLPRHLEEDPRAVTLTDGLQ